MNTETATGKGLTVSATYTFYEYAVSIFYIDIIELFINILKYFLVYFLENL